MMQNYFDLWEEYLMDEEKEEQKEKEQKPEPKEFDQWVINTRDEEESK